MRIYARALAAALAAGAVLSTGGHLAVEATSVAGHGIAAASRTAPQATNAENARTIEAYLRERMDATKTPGMAYAIVTPESIEHMDAWGEDGNGYPVTTDTPFLWGSVAKPVTATALLTLVESGDVDLDEPVRSYLPELALADSAAADRITVRHLLEQTSGIPEGTGITDRFDRRQDPYRDAVAGLADVELLSAPGKRFEYASENYLVLGALVEAVSGRPFHEYLHEHVLDPLEMTGAVTTPEDADDALPHGHSYAFGQPVGVPARYDQAGASYGYLGGSVEDLAHFAMVQLNDGAYSGTRVLDPGSVASMHAGTARVTETTTYGLGWRDSTGNDDLGTSTVWHSGAVNGYQATLVLLPELESGVVVVQNIYGYFQDWELVATGLRAARILAGGEPQPITSDPRYPALLAGLSAVLVAVIGGVGWAAYRLVHRRRTSGSRTRILIGMACWTLSGLALAYGAAVALPDAFGTRVQLIPLWAPDMGWLLIAITVGALLLATTRLIISLRHLRLASR